MSELEVVTLSLSLILGLSMAQMLSTVALAIRSRREARFHWVPLVWVASIFLFHVQFWFALFDVDRLIDGWTWDWFGPVLLMAVLLFLSGALVLPGPGRSLPSDLREDFDAHGRLALAPLSLYLVMWIPLNARLGNGWLTAMNLFDVLLVALAAMVYFSKHPRLRAAMSLVYLAVTFWAVVWVWSPGAAS